MTKLTTRTLTSCVPIFRNELFEEITKYNTSSTQVDNVWIVPGHVFVTLKNSSKLVTFDCKPAIYMHNIDTTTLDFPALKPAILDIFISPLIPNITYIVQENGHVHCSQFSSSFQWSFITEFDLYEKAGSEIATICLHAKLNAFFWCEIQHGESSCSIRSKALPDAIELAYPHKAHTPSTLLMTDCPVSDLFPLEDGLLIVPRYKEKQTRVCIFWRHSVLELVSITTIIGEKVKNHFDMRSPLAFSEVLFNCLSEISQVEVRNADLGAKKDFVTGNVCLLHSDGALQSFHLEDNEEKQRVTVNTIKIMMPKHLLHSGSPRDSWNIHKNIVAIATQNNKVRLYSATEGHLIHEFEMEKGVHVQKLAYVQSPAIMVAMITSGGVIVVQGGKIADQSTEQQCLPCDKHFQTDALHLAFLTQQREENPVQHISDQLSALHSKWKDLQAHQPRSQLSDTVDPYLSEFWHLEEQASQLGRSQCTPLPPVHNTRETLREALIRSRSMTPEAAIAELMGLAHRYPDDMLNILLGDLDIEKEVLTAEDQTHWQTLLGLQSADGHTHQQHNTVTFELVCRLLYQERPKALISFVCHAQSVSEQAVGVSAFVRRKHMLQYYMRAMECLPEPNVSKQPQEASSAKAQIILLGAAEHGPELALRFLLHHSQWSEAIQMLRQLGSENHQYTPLFFLLLQHLLQRQALSGYASEVFSLLPSWKSVLPVLNVMGNSSGVHSATTLPSPFYQGHPDIPLSEFRPHLMALLLAHKK